MADPQHEAIFNAALTKLPQLDLSWPEPVREGWWRCFNALRQLGEEMATHGVQACVPAQPSEGRDA